MDVSNDLTARFLTAMDRLGPIERSPRLAVAVSGGSDSMALVVLAQEWARRRGGEVVALIVDHGLRAESAVEAAMTLRQLSDLGVTGRILNVRGLVRGPALAERARDVRYALLSEACAAADIPHLLLGHHRGDQVETVMMRALSGSAARGLAGMPALVETRFVRLLRPLLDIPPGDLRAFLAARGIAWVEDPSNRDPLAQRARLRLGRGDPSGQSEGTLMVAEAARRAGALRAERDLTIAATLAERATIHPDGYAVLTNGPIDPDALASLMRTIAGAPFAPPIDRVARIAPALSKTTLGGVRITPAGRLGSGWLLTREPRAMREAVAARLNAVWDGRFRLVGGPPDGFARGLSLDALGADAGTLHRRKDPPAAVLHVLPALREGGKLIAVPHIRLGDPRWRILFDPRNPASGAPFLTG